MNLPILLQLIMQALDLDALDQDRAKRHLLDLESDWPVDLEWVYPFDLVPDPGDLSRTGENAVPPLGQH